MAELEAARDTQRDRAERAEARHDEVVSRCLRLEAERDAARKAICARYGQSLIDAIAEHHRVFSEAVGNCEALAARLWPVEDAAKRYAAEGVSDGPAPVLRAALATIADKEKAP